MKQTIILILMLLSIAGMAQVGQSEGSKKNIIGEVKKGRDLLAELSWKTLPAGDTVYFLMYKNREYQQLIKYESLSFYPEGDAVQSLYNEFKNFFSDHTKQHKDYSAKLDIGRKSVTLSFMRGQLLVIAPEGYFMLTERQVDDLFGNPKSK